MPRSALKHAEASIARRASAARLCQSTKRLRGSACRSRRVASRLPESSLLPGRGSVSVTGSASCRVDPGGNTDEPRMRILLADDDSLVTLIVSRVLASWGHEPIVMHDGKSAWERAVAEPAPSVAILDWEMP